MNHRTTDPTTLRRVALAATLALPLLWASSASSETLQDPQFAARLAEFKKVLKTSPEDKQPDPKIARATVTTFASTPDTRVYKELFSALGKSSKALESAQATLDEISDKHRQALESYFTWFMEEYRRTGQKPTTILVVQEKAIETWKAKLLAAAAHFDVRVRIHDALKQGITLNLQALGEQRAAIWQEIVDRGTKAKEDDEEAAFATALGAIGGPEAEAVLLKMEVEGKAVEPLVACIDGLAAMASVPGFARVRARIFEPRWAVASAALQALRRYRHAETVPTVIDFLRATKDERLTLDAYELLFDVTGKHFADDPAPWDGWWKMEGAAFLRRWSPIAAERTSEIEKISFAEAGQADVAAELAALLPNEPDPAVRREILSNLSIHKSYFARVALLRALRDDSKDIKLAAVRGLAHMHHLSVPEALMKLVDDADEELLAAIFQSLRTLWGGEEEFQVTKPDKDELNRWWGLNKERVVDQFLMLGARDIASGKPSRTDEKETAQSRTFYGMHIRSSRVLFCIDNSLSMEEPAQKNEKKQKIEVAKEELARAIKALPEGGRFGIIVFAGFPHVYTPDPDKDKELVGMMPLTKKNREKALDWIQNGFKTDPGTNVYDTMELAFQMGMPKSQFKSPESPDTIYLVSDGDPTVGKFLETEPILDFVRRANAGRRIKIYTIGVGYDHNVDFLRALAEAHGGVYVAR